jgi:hypothetical protein
MQPETPQGNQPAALPPVTPPVPQQPEPPRAQEQSFYSPAAPSPYVGQTVSSQATPTAPNADSISWEASEYVHTDKGGGWLVGLSAVAAVLLGVAMWFAAWTFAILIVVMAVAMAIFAFRPPRVLRYTLNDNGVQINNQQFSYSDYRAFGILEDGAFFTLTLIPIKRFAPALSVYFAEDHGEQIVDIISAHLPMEHLEPDFIDTLMRRLRF